MIDASRPGGADAAEDRSGTYPVVRAEADETNAPTLRPSSSPTEPPASGVHALVPGQPRIPSLGPLLDVAPPEPASGRRGPGTYDRTKTPEQRWDAQRGKLLLAAASVFSEDGYGSASVAAILQRSGLSRGTFYRHFRDLADAFLTVREEAARVLFEAVEVAVRAETDPPAKLRAGITTFLKLVAEHGDLARVFLREGRATGHGRGVEVRQQAIERFAALIRGGLELAVQQGLMKGLPGEITLYALVVAVEGVAIRYLEAHEEARAVEAAPELLDMCFKCFR